MAISTGGRSALAVATALLALATGLVGCRGTTGPASDTASSGDPDLGRTIYADNCAPCHGARGNGAGPAARALFPRPTDFTQPRYRTDSADGPSDDELLATIAEGKPGTSMPAWPRLGDAERRAVVGYLRAIAEGRIEAVPVADAEGVLEALTEVRSDTFLNHAPAVRYIGRDSCRPCHQNRHDSFVQTGMGRSFYALKPERVVEDFRGTELVHPLTGLRYKVFARDGRYFQRQFLLDSRGAELVPDEYELTWVVGSTHHARGYMIQREGRLFQAPICWDPTTEAWIFCPGYEYANSRFGREISRSCVFCHNGRMELVAGERNLFKSIPEGIGCERCHGPGELHVERHSRADATAATGKLDPTIVNPRRLPQRERIHVCFQCHLGDASATERVVRHGRALEDFRPGMRLTDVVVPFRYKQATQWDFGIASQADRLIMSRCYTESGGQIECLTCHDPHVTVYRKDRPPDFFVSKCVSCHGLDACAAPAAARRRTEPADDCVACHMRRGEAVDRKHAQFTDHWIRRKIDLAGRDRRTRVELEPTFPDLFAELPTGEQTYYRARAEFLRADGMPPRVRAEMFDRAAELFERAIEQGFDQPDAHFFLGKTEMYRGRWREMIEQMRAALARDPTHHDAALALGQALSATGALDEATKTFEAMLARDAHDPMALAEHGRMLWQQRRFDEALGAYRRAVEAEPWNATLHVNLGMVLASMGRFAEAAEAGRDAARLDPDSPTAWTLYEKAFEAMGRADEAREGRLRRESLERAGGEGTAAGGEHMGDH